MPNPVLNYEKSDRYASPRARATDAYAGGDQTQPTNLFSAKGRIGRLRYLCWTFLYSR